MIICSNRAARQKNAAFTMIELLAVISIMSAIVFFAFAKPGGNGKVFLEGAHQTVYQGLEKARSRAVLGVRGGDHGIRMTASGIYALEGSPAAQVGGIIPFPPGITSNAGTPIDIVFRRLTGAPSDTATIVLTNGSDGSTKTVSVNSLGAILSQ